MFGNIQTMRMVGKWATLAVFPIMVIVIVMLNRATTAKTADPPESGTLVVASLRESSITLFDFGEEPTSRFLSVGGVPHELVEANGRLYLTSPKPSQIIEVLPGAPSVLRVVELPGQAHGLATQGDSLWVTLDESNELVQIDLVTLEVTLRHGTRSTPHGVTVSDAGVPIVVMARADYVASYDTVPAEERTGSFPESVAVVGDRVVTANAEAGSVSVFALDGLVPLGDITLDGRPVRVLALDDHRFAVTLQGTDQVAIINLETGEVEEQFDSGGRPDGLCLTPERDYLAVVSNADATVQIHSTENWALAFVVGTNSGPGACLWLSQAD